jgi:hypothetical protein
MQDDLPALHSHVGSILIELSKAPKGHFEIHLSRSSRTHMRVRFPGIPDRQFEIYLANSVHLRVSASGPSIAATRLSEGTTRLVGLVLERARRPSDYSGVILVETERRKSRLWIVITQTEVHRFACALD